MRQTEIENMLKDHENRIKKLESGNYTERPFGPTSTEQMEIRPLFKKSENGQEQERKLSSVNRDSADKGINTQSPDINNPTQNFQEEISLPVNIQPKRGRPPKLNHGN